MVDQLSLVRRRGHARGREVGTEGKLGGQAEVQGVSRHVARPDRQRQPARRQPHDQVRNIAEVTTAVASGDLSQKITVDARGEILELKDTINTMVDQLSSLRRRGHARRARGRHGGQARRSGQVEGVSGTWKGLTENVNQLAAQPDHAGARDRRGLDGRDPGRPDPLDHRRGAGRGRGAQGQHQPDDRQPRARRRSRTRSRTG